MKTQQDKIALLEETAAFYNSGNRCVDSSPLMSCKYYLPDKPGCAIGRLIEDKELCRKLDRLSKGSSLSFPHVFNALPSNLREYGQVFLEKLQSLHDIEFNWTDTGLSERGKETVNHIKTEILANRI